MPASTEGLVRSVALDAISVQMSSHGTFFGIFIIRNNDTWYRQAGNSGRVACRCRVVIVDVNQLQPEAKCDSMPITT